jgi:hypothetical protein
MSSPTKDKKGSQKKDKKVKTQKEKPTEEETAKLKEAVSSFDTKKWDEIARFMQSHKRFENNMKSAPLSIPVGVRKEFSSVRTYFTGKVLRKIITSKAFESKFKLKFSKENADVLLVPMLNTKAAQPNLKKNLGKRYFVQAEPWQREPVVKLRLSDPRVKKYSTSEIVPDEYYVWTFQGSVMWRHILLGTVIGCFLLACLFPVWPDFMKLGVWYLSVTILLFLFFFFIARAVIFVALWVGGFDFWILPNILDDELPPVESFKPLYSLVPHPKSRSGWMYRIAVGIVLLASLYWVYVQPNAYHAQMLNEQRSFVDDLYSGKFLSDRSEASASNLDDIVPDYDELLQEELAESGEEELTEEEKAANEILNQILQEDEDLYNQVDEDDE